jgi:ribosome-binding protein aMBF1 (putative translation factor)
MTKNVSPIGSTVSADIERLRAENAEFREAYDSLQPFEELARIVIMRRAELDLTQQELADRMRSTKSVISRIESGRHRTNTDTLRRLAEALGGHAVVGFQFGDEPARDLVRL